MLRARFVLSMIFLSLLALGPHNAAGQNYPSRPIQIIGPFPPGGGTDLVMRLMGQKLNEALGQPVIYDYRSGAAGNLGTALAAKARPDGYTLSMQSPPFTVNPLTMRNVGYDPIKDFTPIILATETAYVIVAHPAGPARNIRELIALGKANPNKLSFGTSGTLAQLGGELLKKMGGFNMTHIPYRGAGPALIDLVGGHLDLSVTTPTAPLPFIRAGRLRVLAVASTARLDILPQVPTVAESGIPGFEVSGWYGLLAPAGTPKEIINRLNSELVRALALPEIKTRLSQEAIKPVASTPEEFAVYLGKETAKWSRLITEIGFKAPPE